MDVLNCAVILEDQEMMKLRSKINTEDRIGKAEKELITEMSIVTLISPVEERGSRIHHRRPEEVRDQI